jgi:hypothetical protein
VTTGSVPQVGEEEEMEDLESSKRREEEESARLERGRNNRVERRRAIKKDTMRMRVSRHRSN